MECGATVLEAAEQLSLFDYAPEAVELGRAEAFDAYDELIIRLVSSPEVKAGVRLGADDKLLMELIVEEGAGRGRGYGAPKIGMAMVDGTVSSKRVVIDCWEMDNLPPRKFGGSELLRRVRRYYRDGAEIEGPIYGARTEFRAQQDVAERMGLKGGMPHRARKKFEPPRTPRAPRKEGGVA